MELKHKIVFKALVGSHNYNLNTPESDKDYKVFVVPTFEDLYYREMFSELIITEKEDNDIHDIRKLPLLFFKANVNFLETLFSKEIIVEDECPEINEILSLKKEIAKMNLPHLYDACHGMHINKMKTLNAGSKRIHPLIDKYGYNTKQALHAYRILNFIERFEATNFEDFESAMRYEHVDLEFMLDIKNGFFTEETFRNFVQHYHDATFVHLKEKYYSQPVDHELRDHIENLIMKMVRRYIMG